jgi:ATP-dependent Clp protease protease subunit
MNILRKSSSGTQVVPMDADFLSRRQLFIEGEIGPESACIFAKCVMLVNAENGTAPIDVYVNSPGGEINAGLLMYDVIQSSHAPIRMHCLGRA